MPEETNGADGRKFEDRLERLECDLIRENRYWRGGLIGVLLLIALALFTHGGHRRHGRPDFTRGGRYGMPYPPQFGYMAGGPWGPCGDGNFGGRWGRPPRPWDGPRPDAGRAAPPPPPSATN